MKRTRYLIIVALIALAGTSCQKDDSNEPLPASNRIKTYTESITSSFLGNFSVTYNLSYDNQNRLISLVNASNSGDRFSFAYNTGGFDMDIFGDDHLVIHQDVYTSGNLMDSTFQYNDEGDTTTEKYTYNPSKQLIQLKRYMYSNGQSELDEMVNYTYDSNNNLVEETSNYSHTTYEYAADAPNTIDLFPIYTGYASKLPSKISSSLGVEIHTYSLDDKNRLTSDKAVFESGDVVLKTFTYE